MFSGWLKNSKEKFTQVKWPYLPSLSNSFNQISSLLDAGTVYSNDDEVQEELRAFKGGQLKMLPVFETEGMKPLLPLKLHEPDEGCIRPSEDVYCFLAGDPRVNEQVWPLSQFFSVSWSLRNHSIARRAMTPQKGYHQEQLAQTLKVCL